MGKLFSQIIKKNRFNELSTAIRWLFRDVLFPVSGDNNTKCHCGHWCYVTEDLYLERICILINASKVSRCDGAEHEGRVAIKKKEITAVHDTSLKLWSMQNPSSTNPLFFFFFFYFLSATAWILFKGELLSSYICRLLAAFWVHLEPRWCVKLHF